MPETISRNLDEEVLLELSKIFHEVLLKDQRINFLFENVDMAALGRKQSWFFTSLALNKSKGTQKYMRLSHEHLVEKYGLADAHFDALINCLEAALIRSALDPDTARHLLRQAENLRPYVLGTAKAD